MRTKRVVVEPYRPAWPEEFQIIRGELARALGEDALAVEHVGSTAVEGLAAKPIIDIDAVIPAGRFAAVREKLAQIGYRHEGDLGIAGREAFQYSGKVHLMKHHLYVCYEDCPALHRHLTFRDWLRTHPEDRDFYGAVKTDLAARFPGDIDGYMAGKAPCIEAIYQKCGLL